MRVLPVNLTTILLELDDLAQTLSLMASLQAEPVQGIEEIVPAARTLLIRFNPGAVAFSDLLGDVSGRRLDHEMEQSGKYIEIPVCYNGADLEEVAQILGMTTEEVVRRHTGSDYLVAFTGFAPGFAYLCGGDATLDVPRRASPRPNLPAGAVALAGGFSAVYPRSSPGGWQIIGLTETPMWDIEREQPALLQPGDRVRFTVAASQTPAASRKSTLPATEPNEQKPESFLVRNSGVQALFQDLGRPGQAKQGVSVSGAMDKASLRAANRLVQNEDSEACIEIAYGGFALVCRRDAVVAVTGAQGPLDVTDSRGLTRPAVRGAAIALAGGDVLTFGQPTAGLYSYLAVRGGFDAPVVLGSRSTDFMAKIGPPPIKANDRLTVRPSPIADAALKPKAPPAGLAKAKEITTIDVVMGPRTDWFSPASIAMFSEQIWDVTAQSNRIGLRLAGFLSLKRAVSMKGRELPSEGTVRGAIQIPTAGQPILFMADHPLTGGYPVMACVADYHLDLVGQLPIGAQIRFRPIRNFEALELTGPRGEPE